MFGIHDLWLFVVAGLLLNVTPGPDTAYVIGRSLQLGFRGGAAAALGIGSGCFVHVFAAAIGLSALLAASSVAFSAVKLIGAAYLIYVGVKMLLSHAGEAASGQQKPVLALRQIYTQGVLTNALNPKVALFFLAFLPQFVDSHAPDKALAFLLLGTVFITTGTLWCLGVAAFAARAAGRVRRSGRLMVWVNRGLGGFFVALGVRIAFADAR